MSLSKEEKQKYMIIAGAAALFGAAVGIYGYMKRQDAVYLDEPIQKKHPMRRTITNKTIFEEKETYSLSHDHTLSQDAIEQMSDYELLAKVRANTKLRHKQIKLQAEAQVRKYKPLIVVGPAGVGKGVLIQKL